MATFKAHSFISSSPPQAYLDFKDDIQSKLIWNQEQWANSNLFKSDRYFFCRNVLYWFNKLVEVKDPKYLVVTIFASGSHYRPAFKDILQSYKLQLGLDGLCGASQTANANYVTLWFSSIEFKIRALQNFCMVQGCFVVHSGWLPQQPLVNFQLNWLPPDIQLSDIRLELEKHVSIVSLHKEVLDLEDGDTLPTGKVLGSFEVNATKPLHSLPHFVNVFPYVAHWIIYLRAVICFNCKWVGHVASHCPTPFCSTCRRLLPRSHLCCVSSVSHIHPSSTQESGLAVTSGVFPGTPVLLSSNEVSQSTDVTVLEESKIPPQNFWAQDELLVLPLSTGKSSRPDPDYVLSSHSEDESLISSSMESILGRSAKASLPPRLSHSVTIERGDKSCRPKFKTELPVHLNSPCPPATLWKPPKGIMDLDFTYPLSNPKTCVRRHTKKK